MKDLTKIYIDLSKCSEEQRKHIFSLLPDCCWNGQYVYNAEFAKHLKYNSYHQSWVTGLFSNDKRLKELTYPEFIKLFEGGEGEKKCCDNPDIQTNTVEVQIGDRRGSYKYLTFNFCDNCGKVFNESFD